MNYKTILINLKKDTDRLEFMTKQLNKLEIPFIRLEAVNGKEYMEKDGSEYDDREAIKQLGRSATLGEIGRYPFH
jgi:GR25 family glycosyltransferase involved in LPS biosynthesis